MRYAARSLAVICAVASIADMASAQTLQPGMWRPWSVSPPQNAECPPSGLSYTWNQPNALNWTTYNGAAAAHTYFVEMDARRGIRTRVHGVPVAAHSSQVRRDVWGTDLSRTKAARSRR